MVLVQLRAYQEDESITVELKTLTLFRMWRGSNLNDEPTVKDLDDLHEELVELEEADLLRPYAPTSGSTETALVGSFLHAEPEHTQFLAVGGARILVRQCN
ncbi:hypothetical protein B0H16DRAFT_1739388 [Mycena metata]|uniref:Uncharacterized protein n=1 Tax=Mycena metata TaxID=1033252 RepID=A0AAD7HGA0_9AGAR|nr:hypothetical protein B0H16DRAFT_1739388 [Mycena metata]